MTEILHQDLQDAITQLEKRLNRLKKRLPALGEQTTIEAIDEIDNMTVRLRKYVF